MEIVRSLEQLARNVRYSAANKEQSALVREAIAKNSEDVLNSQFDVGYLALTEHVIYPEYC